jgi:hypothetical protein
MVVVVVVMVAAGNAAAHSSLRSLLIPAGLPQPQYLLL